MAASTNEPGRIKKCIDGANGMEPIHAVDERIDNALDAGCDRLELFINQTGCIYKIHDNGTGMKDNEGRCNYLTLDGVSKKNDSTKRGMYGIGSMQSRGSLVKDGTETTTSVNNNGAWQVDINMGELSRSEDPRCWSGGNGPKWEKIDNTKDTYQRGVTIEFDGENLPRFEENEIASHMQDKYCKELKGGVKFIMNINGIEYDITYPFKEEAWTDDKTTNINVMKDGNCRFECSKGGKEQHYRVSYDKNGVAKSSPTSDVYSKDNARALMQLTASFPKFDVESFHNEKQTNPKLSIPAYIISNYSNQFHISDKQANSIAFQYGENSLIYPCENEESGARLIDMFTGSTKFSLNGLRIAKLNKPKLSKMPQGDARLAGVGRFCINIDSNAAEKLNIINENKSIITMESRLKRACDTVIECEVKRHLMECKAGVKKYEAVAVAVAVAAAADAAAVAAAAAAVAAAAAAAAFAAAAAASTDETFDDAAADETFDDAGADETFDDAEDDEDIQPTILTKSQKFMVNANNPYDGPFCSSDEDAAEEEEGSTSKKHRLELPVTHVAAHTRLTGPISNELSRQIYNEFNPETSDGCCVDGDLADIIRKMYSYNIKTRKI